MIEESKMCSACKEFKSLNKFNKNLNSRSPDGHYSQCKECRKLVYQENKEQILEEHKNYYGRNAEKKKKYQRDYSARKKAENPYWRTEKSHKEFARDIGIPFEELESWYEKQWMKQQAQCAICGMVFGEEVIDHDHITNKLRGLLCSNCNTGIGMLKDSSELCLKASEYLTRY